MWCTGFSSLTFLQDCGEVQGHGRAGGRAGGATVHVASLRASTGGLTALGALLSRPVLTVYEDGGPRLGHLTAVPCAPADGTFLRLLLVLQLLQVGGGDCKCKRTVTRGVRGRTLQTESTHDPCTSLQLGDRGGQPVAVI